MRYLTFLFAALALSAHAQFDVSLKLPRSTFVALEAITATVTITNRSGAEAVLGGPGRESWLSFSMTDNQGRPLAPMDVDGSELLQIPPGVSVTQRITVTDAYAPAEIGNYALTARVLHYPTSDYYASNRAIFNITEIKPMWEQSIGVPEGFRDAGKTRKFTLAILREMETTSLYFRLLDEKSGVKLTTYRLGPVNMVLDPQITVDTKNQLQLLFLAQPQTFAYVVIAPNGDLKKRSYYLEVNGSRPQLVAGAKGQIEVVGGKLYNPNAPVEKPKGPTGRGVSEKPPGL